MAYINHPLLVELQPIEGVTRVGSWSACSSITSGSRTMTVDPAALTGIQDGDYMLMVATVGSSSSGPDFDEVPTGWEVLFTRGTSGGSETPFSKRLAAYGRTYRTGDTAWSWRVNYFTNTQACWTIIAFRNVGLHPFDHIILEPGETALSESNLYASPRVTNSAVSYVVTARPHDAPGPLLDYDSAAQLQPFRYIAGVNHKNAVTNDSWDIQFARVLRGTADNQLVASQAIGTYGPCNSEGLVNLEATDRIRSGSLVKYDTHLRFINSGTAQQHYVSRFVSFTAGKRYWIRALLCATVSSSTDHYWAAVVAPPSGGLVGRVVTPGARGVSSSTLSGQITLSPAGGRKGNGYSGLPDHVSCDAWFAFDATETGLHEIRLILVRQSLDLLSYSRGAAGTFSSSGTSFGGLAVAEGYLPLPMSTDSSGNPASAQFQDLSPGLSYDFQPAQRLNSPSTDMMPSLSGELVMPTTPLRAVKLRIPLTGRNPTRLMDSSLLGYTNAFPRPYYNWDDVGSSLNAYGFIADRCVHPTYDLGAGPQAGKYYWEATVVGDVSSQHLRIGVGPCVAADTPNLRVSVPMYVGRRGNGSVAENRTYTAAGTVPALVTGDVLGFALDIPNATLAMYTNGTLSHTASLVNTFINANIAPKCVYWAMLGAGNDNFDKAQDPEFSFAFNFAGPFTYSKPSGYVAYDYANEVP